MTTRVLCSLALLAAACQDTTTRTGCRNDGQCAAGKWCRVSDGRCMDGCRDDAGCPEGQICDLSTHACVAGCTAEHPCPTPQVCRVEGKTCVECLEDAHCADEHRVCSLTNTCIEGCSADRPCASPNVCDLESRTCVRCLGDHGCPEAQICDLDAKTCIPGCSITKPCREPLVCDVAARTCVVCLNDDNCGPGFLCDTATRTCTPGCTQAHACPTPKVCRLDDGVCVDCVADGDCAGAHDVCTSLNTCVDGCSTTKPCESPEVCDTPSRTCVACLTDTDCSGAHEVCSSAHTCVNGCSSAKPCDAPQFCDTAARTCVECLADDQCPAGKLCNTSTHACVAGCTTAHPCPQGQNCVGGQCAAAPTITGFTPTRGFAGSTVVTINGTNFGTVRGTVTFTNGVDATTITTWTDTAIVARVPPGAETGPITVDAANGSVTSAQSFTILLGCTGSSLQVPSPAGTGQGWLTVNDPGASSSLKGGNRLTLEAWIFPTTSAAGQQNIVYKEYQYVLALVAGKLQAQVYINNAWSGLQGTITPPANQWSHVAVVYDGWAIRTYVNGAVGSETPLSGFVNHSSLAMHVGSNAGSNSFTGFIDEVRLSDVVRYTGPSFVPPTSKFEPDAATLALYHLDEGSGSSAEDASGNINTGALQQGAAFSTLTPSLPCVAVLVSMSPDVGGAGTTVTLTGAGFGDSRGTATVEFNGVAVAEEDYVSWIDSEIVVRAPAGGSSGRVTVKLEDETLTSGADFKYQPCDERALQLPYNANGNATAWATVGNTTSLGGGLTVTLEAWFYPTLSNANTQHILYKEYQYQLSYVSGKVQGRLYINNAWTAAVVGPNASTGAWRHVAMSYDGAAVRMFVDGQMATPVAQSGRVNGSTLPLHIGSNSGSNPAYGQIDEVRISNTARYKQAFTPPKGPFAPDDFTSALLHLDESEGALYDATNNNNAAVLGGAAATNTFAALGCGPAISDVAPRSAPIGGGNVSIIGRGFGDAEGTVKQGTATLTVVSWSDTEVVVAIPAEATGALTLTTAANVSTSTGFPVNAFRCGGGSIQFPVNNSNSPNGVVTVSDPSATGPIKGGGKITLEAWIYPTFSVTGTQHLLYKEYQHALSLVNNQLRVKLYINNAWTAEYGLGTAPLNQWSHVAAVYNGHAVRTFVNGAMTNHPPSGPPDYVSGNVNHSSLPLHIGSNSGSNPFYGRMDEVRISGTVRYTGPFTPPTGALAPDDFTQALFHFDDGELAVAAADASANGLTGSLGSAARFTDDAPGFACGPVVSGLTPPVGGAGTRVTIDGVAFGATRGTSQVTFNDVPAQATDYVSWADGRIVVKAPAAGSTGRVKVTVGTRTGDGGIDFLYAPCSLYALQLPYNQTGSSEAVATASDPSAQTSLGGGTRLTAEMWFYPTHSTTGDQYLLYKEYQYVLGYGNGKIKARLYINNAWSTYVIGGTPALNQWHHVGFVYDGSRLQVFIDGVLGASPLLLSGIVNHSSLPLHIGSNAGSTPAYGLIDEVRISSTVRYREDFTPPNGPFTPDPFTSALWHFDEGTFQKSAADATTHNNAANLSATADMVPSTALTCGPTVNDVAQPRAVPLGGGQIAILGRGFGTTTGKVTQGGVELVVVSWSDTQIVVMVPAGGEGLLEIETAGGDTTSTGVPVNALSCQGWALQLPTTSNGSSNGVVTLDDPSASTSLAGGPRLTLEAWIKPTLSVTGTQYLIYKEYQYTLALVNNKFQARMYINNAWSSYVGQGPVNIGEWNHVAAVYDGHDLRTYVNGQLANNPSTGAVDHLSGLVNHSSLPLHIGSNSGSSPFYGYMDEVLVSGRVRYAGTTFDPPVRHRPHDPTDHVLLHFDDGPLATSAADATLNGHTGDLRNQSELVFRDGGARVCPPIVEDAQKRAVAPGDTVVVTGSNFGATRGTSTIDFNGTEAASYTGWSDTSAAVTVPSGASTGPVSLTRNGDLYSSPFDVRVAPCAMFALQLPYGTAGSANGYWTAADSSASTSLRGGPTVTVEAWVRPTYLPTGTSHIVYKEYQYQLNVVNGVLKAQAYLGNNAWTGSQGLGTLTAGQWHHVAFTWNASTKQLRTFLNGTLTNTFTSGCTTGTQCYINNGSSLNLHVGSNAGGSPFYGEIEEVRLSNVVRYSADFTRPSTWFTSDSNTTGLWHFNDGEDATAAADSSGNNNWLNRPATTTAQLWPSTAPITCP